MTLNEKELEKVTGGFQTGDHRIVECEICKGQFDPDTAERGSDDIKQLENGGYGYATYKCPFCNEFRRVTIIQVKVEDLNKYKVIYFGD